MIGLTVKVKQKNAPYGFYGATGHIIDSDMDLGGVWYLVRIHEPNAHFPYESFFLAEHLELI